MPEHSSPILGGFSTQRSPSAADNDAVNLAVEIIETKDGKVPGYLFMMSGLIQLYTAGSGPIRGMLALNGLLYAVSGGSVYSITSNGTVTFLGTVNGTIDPVSMFQNTRQLMILDGIGAWLAPGGYPLTNGTPSGGSLYALGDTIVLNPYAGGSVTAYPQIQVTQIANNPATSVDLINAGSGYSSASNVTVTPIQPQPGNGSGLTLNITESGGTVTAIAVNAGGLGYVIGDTGFITGGGGNSAAYQVVTVAALGVVTSARVLGGGVGYSNTTGAATHRGSSLPPNVGTGLTLNTTAVAGAVTAISIANGGNGYQLFDCAVINGGGGTATIIVASVGGNGVVTSFSILTGGAISSPAGAWTQQSSDGSGQGFTLQSPSYGAFQGLVPITLPFDDPVAGVVLDGFGLAVFLNQQNIAQSNLLDLSTWKPLAFGVADQSPDNIVSIASFHDEAYLFKQRNTEVWVDQGNSPFAFGPVSGVHIEFGCAAAFSPSKCGNDLIWLTRNDQGQGVFIKVSAYNPIIISTQALTNELQQYPNISDCIAYSRQEGGHLFYVATFPSANVTWCYDLTSSELAGFPIWTRMAAFSNGELDRHIGNAFTTWDGGLPAVTTSNTYQAQSVEFSTSTTLQTAAGLNGLPTSFFAAVFSVWLQIADGGGNTGITFGNQQGGTKPGFQVNIQNDSVGAPEIVVKAWDANSNPIVVANYNFATWSNWVNVLVSLDTATQQIEVWANTLTGNLLVETNLTPSSVTWSSTNPIGALAATPWSLAIVP
jgi:hypothetical protein